MNVWSVRKRHQAKASASEVWLRFSAISLFPVLQLLANKHINYTLCSVIFLNHKLFTYLFLVRLKLRSFAIYPDFSPLNHNKLNHLTVKHMHAKRKIICMKQEFIYIYHTNCTIVKLVCDDFMLGTLKVCNEMK